MPELMTKHPDIVLKILRDAGIQCSTGEKQQILISCPREQFCKLPTGELCVYGISQMPAMTQLSKKDFTSNKLVTGGWDYSALYLLVMVFFVGLAVGYLFRKR